MVSEKSNRYRIYPVPSIGTKCLKCTPKVLTFFKGLLLLHLEQLQELAVMQCELTHLFRALLLLTATETSGTLRVTAKRSFQKILELFLTAKRSFQKNSTVSTKIATRSMLTL